MLTIETADEGKRLDNLLARYARHQPRDYLYRLIRTGQVRLDKKRAKASTRVVAGQLLRLPPHFFTDDQAPGKPPDSLLAEAWKSVVHEDDHLVLVNKPAGMPVHAGSGHSFGVVELLRAVMNSEEGGRARFPELVHRIDRLTSGCLLLAKDATALNELQQLWRERRVAKTYLALVHRHLNKPQSVELPLLVSEQEGGKRVVVDYGSGKSATTRIVPLSQGMMTHTPVTLVRCLPESGRMHQLRVHCQSIGHPIVGDPLYQNRKQHQWSARLLGESLMLHAAELQFNWRGDEYAFSAPGAERLTEDVAFDESPAKVK